VAIFIKDRDLGSMAIFWFAVFTEMPAATSAALPHAQPFTELIICHCEERSDEAISIRAN
jgi:hypothetical protein